MTPEQRKQLISILENDETVSNEWARIIFPPEKRECELIYLGKEREEDVIAGTMALPLQAVRTFNKTDGDWQNKLVFGDNLQAMRSLLEEKRAGRLICADGTPGVRLVFIDPPFATQRDFRGNQDQKAYQDKVAGAEFLEFIRKRLILIRELLTDDGSVFVHMDWRKIHGVKLLMDEIFGENRLQNQIIWQRHDPHNDAKTRFGRIHDTLLWYSKAEKPIYNFKDVTESLSAAAMKEYSLCRLENGDIVAWDESLEGKGKRFKLDDCTVKGNNPDRKFVWRGAKPSSKRVWPADSPAEMDELVRKGILYLRNPEKGAARCRVSELDRRQAEGQLAQDIWLNLGRMKGGSSYPTEKPELLLNRIILSASNPGDLVLDAFAGSGTTLAVAEKLGRRWVGIDCGKLSIYTIQKRLLNLKEDIGNKGKALKTGPFTLYNAGLYDFGKLRELPWESWRFFALQLFQCKDEPHTIRGIRFDGYLKGASVLVFNHRENGGAMVSEETLHSIHEAIGDKVSSRVFVIAPSMSFDFQRDYIPIGDVRYYALRIPYSIVQELHKREFTALRQPSIADDVNDTVESVGFDFIQPPEVSYKAGSRVKEGSLLHEGFIKLESFRSEANVRAPMKSVDSFETLSMIMIDYDYDTETDVFNFDAVHYSAALAAAGWEIAFPLEKVGNKMMVVFLDLFGNEAREIIEAETFADKKIEKPKKTKKAAKK